MACINARLNGGHFFNHHSCRLADCKTFSQALETHQARRNQRADTLPSSLYRRHSHAALSVHSMACRTRPQHSAPVATCNIKPYRSIRLGGCSRFRHCGRCLYHCGRPSACHAPVVVTLVLSCGWPIIGITAVPLAAGTPAWGRPQVRRPVNGLLSPLRYGIARPLPPDTATTQPSRQMAKRADRNQPANHRKMPFAFQLCTHGGATGHVPEIVHQENGQYGEHAQHTGANSHVFSKPTAPGNPSSSC